MVIPFIPPMNSITDPSPCRRSLMDHHEWDRWVQLGNHRKSAHAARTGRRERRPQGRPGSTKGRIRDMVMISERPAEVEDRAVPGHWEVVPIMGICKASIRTLVERHQSHLWL
jgi:IS30 family transposase